MPKHGWKWRQQNFIALTPEEQEDFLSNYYHRISGRFAKWAYQEMPLTFEGKFHALQRVALDEQAIWAVQFLLSELETKKAEDFGDWIIIAACRRGEVSQKLIDAFVDVYTDSTSHPLTKGSAVFGLSNQAQLLTWIGQPVPNEIREVCKKALYDMENPYARAGACWLAGTIGGFEERLNELKSDETPVNEEGGPTVADHILE